MPHAFSILISTSLSLLVAGVVRLHYLRAKLAMKVFDDQQFQSFQREGMPGSGFNNPRRLIWEYRFVRAVLTSSNSRTSTELLKQWNWCFIVMLAAAISLMTCSLILLLRGQ
jgi:hypothetical protein